MLLKAATGACPLIVANGGATLANGGAQHFFDLPHQAFQPLATQAASRGSGSDPGPEQGFAGVDVAHADDDAAVHDQGLDRPVAAPAVFPQIRGVEGGVEGFDAESIQIRTGGPFFGSQRQDHAEAARIGIDQGRAVVQDEDRVVVFFAAFAEEQIAAHPQVDEQGMAGVQVEQQIFGAASGRGETGVAQAA